MKVTLPSEELLLVAGSLRETGFDNEAQLFINALFDEIPLANAIQALERIAYPQKTSIECTQFLHATEVAFRMYQRLKCQLPQLAN